MSKGTKYGLLHKFHHWREGLLRRFFEWCLARGWIDKHSLGFAYALSPEEHELTKRVAERVHKEHPLPKYGFRYEPGSEDDPELVEYEYVRHPK